MSLETIKTPPPRSAAQIEASRANGAKSKGPITAEGKAIVATNRIIHGFHSMSITLANESQNDYDAHLASYFDRYAPIDKVEAELVGLLAANMWQVMRINTIEIALFDLEISALDEVAVKKRYAQMDDCGRLALAFRNAHKENTIELLRRYKSIAERAYHCALQAIEQLRKDRGPVETQKPPVEAEDGIGRHRGRHRDKLVKDHCTSPSKLRVERAGRH